MLPKADKPWSILEAAHLLNRAGFGGSPSDIKNLHALGREKAVDSLLGPDEPLDAFPVPEWSSDEKALAEMRMRMDQRREAFKAMRGLSAEEAEKKKRETFQAIQQESRQQALEAQGWWFRRMLMTRAPLREKMTLFWHDHFATSVQKVKQPVLMAPAATAAGARPAWRWRSPARSAWRAASRRTAAWTLRCGTPRSTPMARRRGAAERASELAPARGLALASAVRVVRFDSSGSTSAGCGAPPSAAVQPACGGVAPSSCRRGGRRRFF
jgi:hypothetical protein